MLRVAALFSLTTACAATPPPAPAPEPCPVVEPEPCDAVTAEQRAILTAVAEVVAVPVGEQPEALRALVDENAVGAADVARLRKELEACSRTSSELRQRVEQLEANLEELKRLTIEMEMKAK